MKSSFNRFLIIRTDRIGDVLLTLPMAKVIKRHYPQAEVSMLIRRYTSELVEDDGNIDHILYYDAENYRLKSFLSLIGELREHRFDVVIHTQPRPRLAFVTWFAKIPLRIGTGYRWYSPLFNKKVYEHRKDALRHELEYNVNLLSPLGCSSDGISVQPILHVKPELLISIKKLLERKGIQQNEKIVIIHPGTGGSAKMWSVSKFGDLAHRLGNISGVRVVITGKKDEEQIVNSVLSKAGSKAIPLVDFGNLRDFAALGKLSSLFISNSTGPIHLAAAVGTPVIGLYPQITAQNAVRWGPYTDKKTVFSPVNKPVDCDICQTQTSSICECMESIPVDEVYQAALKYIRE